MPTESTWGRYDRNEDEDPRRQARARRRAERMNTDELIRQLHQARQAEAEARKARDAQMAELEKLEAYQRYQEYESWYKDSSSEARAIELQVKDALLEPALAGDRHPAVHAVRSRMVWHYEDEAALKWAKSHLPRVITIDRKLFEKYLDEAVESEFMPMPPFVDGEESVSISLKRDLSEFVVVEEREDAD